MPHTVLSVLVLQSDDRTLQCTLVHADALKRGAFHTRANASVSQISSGLPVIRLSPADRKRLSKQGDRLFTKVVYPTASSSEVRTRLRMRSTVRGANNRLDILAITSYDRDGGGSSDLSGEAAVTAQPPQEQAGHGPNLRGLATLEYVPGPPKCGSCARKQSPKRSMHQSL